MYIEIKILGGIGVKFIDLIPNICDGLPFEKGDLVLLNFWGDNEDLKILDEISENLSKKGIFPFKHQCSNSFFKKVVINLIRNGGGFPDEYLSFLSSFKHVIDIFMYPPPYLMGFVKVKFLSLKSI